MNVGFFCGPAGRSGLSPLTSVVAVEAGVSCGGPNDGGNTGSPCLEEVKEADEVLAVGAGDICGRVVCSLCGGDAAAATAMSAAVGMLLLCCLAPEVVQEYVSAGMLICGAGSTAKWDPSDGAGEQLRRQSRRRR